MSRLPHVLVLGFGLGCFAAAAPAQIRVAVEDGSPSGSGAGAVAQLNDDTFFDFEATLVVAADIDSLAELAAYDVVVLGGSGNNDADWTDTMASTLRTWVEAGGAAVLTGWGNLEFDNIPVAGSADLEALFPTPNGSSNNEWGLSPSLITFSGSHPVVAGIPDFALGDFDNDCCIELNHVGVEAGDLLLATMPLDSSTGDGVAVAVKEAIGEGCSAYLGPIYLGDAGEYADVVAALRSGLADRLFEQAAAWGGNGCAGPETTSVLEVPALSRGGLISLVSLLAVAGALAIRRLRP